MNEIYFSMINNTKKYNVNIELKTYVRDLIPILRAKFNISNRKTIKIYSTVSKKFYDENDKINYMIDDSLNYYFFNIIII